MRQVVRKFLGLAELARFELSAAAVSNAWLMVFLSAAIEPPDRRPAALERYGLWGMLGLTFVVATGLIVCAMALNDVLDARHDKTFAPNRPIPSGQVRPPVAAAVAMGSLLTALGAALPLGLASTTTALLAGAGVLFFNIAGRFVPAIGIVSLGLITALGMMLPNPRTSLVWPIVLAMTHVMACATLRYWLAGKRPRLGARDGWGILAGWAFWTLVLVGLTSAGGGVAPMGARWIWVGPLVAVVVFAVLSFGVLHRKMGPERARRAAGMRFAWLSGAWLVVYDAAWLVSAGLAWQAGAVLGLLALAVGMGAGTRLARDRRALPPRIGLPPPSREDARGRSR